ncbi:MAG: carboxypeptidase-like regulatory domain-containing protein [Bacteroidales bacterium]|nr:carboxypeptidase-like regulatory domain-containing protein [Bacteroidales bacterium]
MSSLKSILLVVFLLIGIFAYSQNLTLKGHISDRQGNNLFAVNVYLQKQNTIGTTADLDGNFILVFSNGINLEDEYLVFSFIGYDQLKIPFNSIDFSSPLNVVLFENSQAINEVVVEGRKSISKEFSIKELDKLKIYISPLSSADPLKALAMLPSSTNTDETANPELRGSEANRTKVFLNGVPISNPVRNSQLNGIGFFSLLNTEMIKNEFIYPSNPPLIYGNTSAGLIDIETEEKLSGNNYQISMTLASSGINVSQRINDKSFIQLYGNKMYSDGYLFINKNLDKRLKGFNSNDFGLNYHNNLTDNISFNFYNYVVSEASNYMLNMFTWQDNAKANTIRDFSILNLKYQKSKNSLSINVGTNHSKSHFLFGNINSTNTQKQVYTSINFKHLFSERLSIQTGMSNDYGQYTFKDQVPEFYFAMSPTSPSYRADTVIKNRVPEGYLYFRWNPIRKIIWGIGMRKNFVLSEKDEPSYLSVQTNLRYNFSKDNSVLFSIGQYHNFTEPNYSQKEARLLSAKHFSIEYIYEKKNTTINLAAYYKFEEGDISGARKIKGAEIYFEQDLFKSLKVSISNTILNSEISFHDMVYNADNSVGYFLVSTLSYFNNHFMNMAISWSNRQGKLYTPISSSIFNVQTNFYEPLYSNETNSNRFNNYNSINLSLSKMFILQKCNLLAFISTNNLLNTKNQKNLNYNSDYSQSTYGYYQMRSAYFGIVLSFK